LRSIEGVRFLAWSGADRLPPREWWGGTGLLQWNLTHSAAPVLRGMHLHGRYDEVYLLLAGSVQVGLRDLRPGSNSHGRGDCFRVAPPCPAIVIPRGVLHGLLFLEPGLLLTGRSREHDGLDEWRCRWDDPGLELGWSAERPLLSEEDSGAGSLKELMTAFEAWHGQGWPA